jgi:hypothetical protein
VTCDVGCEVPAVAAEHEKRSLKTAKTILSKLSKRCARRVRHLCNMHHAAVLEIARTGSQEDMLPAACTVQTVALSQLGRYCRWTVATSTRVFLWARSRRCICQPFGLCTVYRNGQIKRKVQQRGPCTWSLHLSLADNKHLPRRLPLEVGRTITRSCARALVEMRMNALPRSRRRRP